MESSPLAHAAIERINNKIMPTIVTSDMINNLKMPFIDKFIMAKDYVINKNPVYILKLIYLLLF